MSERTSTHYRDLCKTPDSRRKASGLGCARHLDPHRILRIRLGSAVTCSLEPESSGIESEFRRGPYTNHRTGASTIFAAITIAIVVVSIVFSLRSRSTPNRGVPPIAPATLSIEEPPSRAPTSAAPAQPLVSISNRPVRLRAAQTWMYQLQDLDQPDAITALAATEYPLLVIEPGQNLKDGPWDTQGMLRQLRRTPSGNERLLLAYINIGQAEDYRTYWQRDWVAPTATRRGRPDFLLTVDPAGWSGNYPVAFWRRAWQDLWLGERGMVATLARMGFDGVHLDWVEAYEDEHVVAAATAERVDPARAMVDFIAAMRATGRTVTPDFLVIPQNAPDLIKVDPERYAATIDGLAVEDTWYHGDANATWEDPHGGDQLSVDPSTVERLRTYRAYLDRGLPVFSVDYALQPANVARVYREARAARLRPLVTRVSLSRLTETPPPAP